MYADRQASSLALFSKLHWIPFYEQCNIAKGSTLYKRIYGFLPSYLDDHLVINYNRHWRDTRYANRVIEFFSIYHTTVNSTLRARWLASSEVISQVLFTSEQPKKNKMAFVGTFAQIKLLFGPLDYFSIFQWLFKSHVFIHNFKWYSIFNW